MKKMNKYLLIFLGMCSICTKIQTTKKETITSIKTPSNPKAKPTFYNHQRKKIATLLALFAHTEDPYSEITKLFASQNIDLRNPNQWTVKLRATPPFCTVEPKQKKIEV